MPTLFVDGSQMPDHSTKHSLSWNSQEGVHKLPQNTAQHTDYNTTQIMIWFVMLCSLNRSFFIFFGCTHRF